jgi:tetratricopeptide (TPR) repeat protein
MNTKAVWLSILAVVISFIGGFFLANALNKSELEALKAETNRLKSSTTENSSQNPAEQTLSDDEIKRRIAEADQNPDNFQSQKNLGKALYQYGSIKKDTKLLTEVERLLIRANKLNPADKDVIVTLGNLYFDLGYFLKDNENLKKARGFYEKILEQTPDDVDVRTDNALTYYLQTPPDNEKAISEFEKSLKDNPKHEKTLQYMIQALLRQKRTEEAETYRARLQEIDPNTPTMAQIQALMEQ